MDYPIYPNGINGVTGEYLGYLNLHEKLYDFARQNAVDTPNYYLNNRTGKTQNLGLPYNIDPLNVQRAGWGIVFPTRVRDDVRQCLQPLIDHRRRTIPPDRCKILEYREGDDVRGWLKGYNVSPGNITPTRVPFYLLLIGNPSEIPFEFQYLLSIEYAVGRLDFPQPAQYAQYASSLISYEKSSTSSQREICFWSPRHDKATQLSADFLVAPLTKPDATQGEKVSIAHSLAYQTRCFIGEKATKRCLGEILHSVNDTPAILFTASHGLGWPKGHERQKEKQGALVCQDWESGGDLNESCYFAASDVADKARLCGLVIFSFACYSAGTPSFDSFKLNSNWRQASTQNAKRIADTPFIAALPQKMLSHAGGSALAFIGHVDRAWGYSIKPPDIDEQITPFRNCIARIMSGEPVGLSTRDFTQRCAMLSAALLGSFNGSRKDLLMNDREMLWAWIECADAQSYIVLGDPATRICV